VRTCVVCRTSGPKAGLLRIVRLADGQMAVDPYVCDDPACRRDAVVRGALARALRTPLTPDLEAELGLATRTTTTTEGGSRGQE
jgi:predicted RNA-binding protein YlxR (DUF448 family)